MTWNFLYNFLYFLDRFGSNKTSPHKCQGSTDSCSWRFFTIHWCINIFNPHQMWEIFVFFLLSFPQNERKCISFAQFVYFFREVCLIFNFWIVRLIQFILSERQHYNLFPVFKPSSFKNWKLNTLPSKNVQTEPNLLGKTNHFSLILREQEEKKSKYFAP